MIQCNIPQAGGSTSSGGIHGWFDQIKKGTTDEMDVELRVNIIVPCHMRGTLLMLLCYC